MVKLTNIRTYSWRLPLNLCARNFAGKPDRILREQFQGRERQNKSYSGEQRNIYSLRHKLKGRGSVRGYRHLKERLLGRDIVGNLEVPTESIVLLPLGKKKPKSSIHLFWTNNKKSFWLYPVILNMNKTYPRKEKKSTVCDHIVLKNIKLQINE